MICSPCQRGGRLGQQAAASARPSNYVIMLFEAGQLHAQCKGGTWCDCRHMEGTNVRPDRKADPRRGG